MEIKSDSKKDKSPSSKRPDNTAFSQQRLPAWQPLLSASLVLPLFFFVGLTFIGIGIGLNYSSNNITELEFDYTGTQSTSNCSQCAITSQSCICYVQFNISKLFQGPVFMYYELSNFYQNHYRYGKSKDDNQLSGVYYNLKNPVNECFPYQWDNLLPIAPCGAIANSMFNDSFSLLYKNNGKYEEVPSTGKGIAWWTDYNIKYKNPSNETLPLWEVFEGTEKPKNWPHFAYNLSSDPYNNGFINEDFLVWMRTAALPNFRKLYRRIESGNFTEGLRAGEYMIKIAYNYPVLSFGGKKKVVFSSVSWMGGKNPFLGIAYLVVGALCTLVAIIMLIVFIKYQGKNDDDDI